MAATGAIAAIPERLRLNDRKWVKTGPSRPYLIVMETEPDRSTLWRELRMALLTSKTACTAERRDALLDQACDWAQRLADTADPTGPEPRQVAYFLDIALTDVSDAPWAVEL